MLIRAFGSRINTSTVKWTQNMSEAGSDFWAMNAFRWRSPGNSGQTGGWTNDAHLRASVSLWLSEDSLGSWLSPFQNFLIAAR